MALKITISETPIGWSWQLFAKNGACLAVDGIQHSSRLRCLRAVERFVTAVRTEHIKSYEKGKYIGEVVASYSADGNRKS